MDQLGVAAAAHRARVLVGGILRAAVQAAKGARNARDQHLHPGQFATEGVTEQAGVELHQLAYVDLDAREGEAARQLFAQPGDELLANLADGRHHGAVIAATVQTPLGPGQRAIRFRDAIVAGDAALAARWAGELDEAHRYEVLLGDAVRDGRGDFAAAGAFLSGEANGDWLPLCRALLGEADTALDDEAASLVAARVVPDRWVVGGRPLAERLYTMDDAARAYAAGIDGLTIVDAFAHEPLHAAVWRYYRRGTLFALGPRPMLVLAGRAALR